MWRYVAVVLALAAAPTGCSLGAGHSGAGATPCGAMPLTASHPVGTTTVPRSGIDVGRLLRGLRRRDLRLEVPVRWSAAWFSAPSLGPAKAGERVPRGSVVKLVHVWSPLGSPGRVDGSHRVTSVVGLTLHEAVSLAYRNEVPWQTSAPALSARATPPDLFDA
jgi:hypothetical protein